MARSENLGRRRTFGIFVVAAFLLQGLPLASAAWRVQGNSEPDTSHDNPTYMWRDAPPAFSRRIYFNAVPHITATGLNPNVAATGSQVYPAGLQSWHAYLGVWEDCNGDGYMGYSEAGLFVYPSTVIDPWRCPATILTPHLHAHNDGRWIRELLWIGPFDVVGDQDLDGDVEDDMFAHFPGSVHSPGTLVWGDHGLPGATDDVCPVRPPQGATASTGALIGYADCHLNRRAVNYTNFVNGELESWFRLGEFGFADPENPHTSTSPLNQDLPANLWGNPYYGAGPGSYQPGLLEDGAAPGGAGYRPGMTVWDCSPQGRTTITDAGLVNLPSMPVAQLRGPVGAGPAVVTLWRDDGRAAIDPTPNDRLVTVGGVMVSIPSIDVSLYDLANHTQDGAIDNCETDDEALAPAIEQGRANSRIRRESDIVFRFHGEPIARHPALGTYPSDLGLNPARAAYGPGWIGSTGTPTEPHLLRGDGQPSGAQYVTFYAYVGLKARNYNYALPGGIGYYGAEACGERTSGTHRGWDCDSGSWWRDAVGNDIAPRQAYGPQRPHNPTSPWGPSRLSAAFPGQPYHLRDIDCFDGSLVQGSPAYVSLQAFTDDKDCDDAPGDFDAYWGIIPELDEDFNGIGDAFQRKYRLTQEQIEEALQRATDFDVDKAGLIAEFKWDTIPIAIPGIYTPEKARDHDNDNWLDGEEIAYWDANADPLLPSTGLAYRDPDSFVDIDGDQEPNQFDWDSDGDDLRDGDEVKVHGTYPEFADSDCAAGASVCTRPRDTKFGDPRRVGGPGTGDGIPDDEEISYWNAYPMSGGYLGDACDHDGIPQILDPDSDDDDVLDGAERLAGTNPCLADEDGDGLKDGEERALGTDPRDPDTDDDGMPDGWEADHVPATRPTVADAHQDYAGDGDGLANGAEYSAGSDPRVRDTDGDGLTDREEVIIHGTDPTWWDSDRDGMHDAWEVTHGLRPMDPRDAHEDPDRDGVDTDGDGEPDTTWTNYAEYQYPLYGAWNDSVSGVRPTATDPHDADSNNDGISDGTAAYGLPTDDTDKDGLTNQQEGSIGTHFGEPDTDRDGVCDGGRATSCRSPGGSPFAPGETLDYRSSPFDVDSDSDGISDRNEILRSDPQNTGTAPDTDLDGLNEVIDRDSDNDRLSDGEEVTWSTQHDDADSDDDGLTDGEEVIDQRELGYFLDPLNSDTDHDGLLDGTEVQETYTHPVLSDTDGDGLSDGDEVNTHLTDPHRRDTDLDGMPDGWEILHGLDPLLDDAADDEDMDAVVTGLTNLQEYLLGTNPRDSDSEKGVSNPITGEEGDGINDHLEILLGLDPTRDDTMLDTDGDGLTNLVEAILRTDPYEVDTDGDGIWDGDEAGLSEPLAALVGILRTDPALFDTDGDGLDDGRERALWDRLSAGAWMTDHDGDGVVLPTALSHNLRDADSDNDGLDDGQEFLVFNTEPHKRDTDGDGDSDYEEIMLYATDPRDPDSNRASLSQPPAGVDSDGDGLSDHAEGIYGTDPADPDSDDDLMWDGVEFRAWGPDRTTPFDGGGNNNLLDPDADDDGLLDGVEFASSGFPRASFYATSPRIGDSDGDGLGDAEEDTNGLAGEAIALARGVPLPTLPLASGAEWWTGIDEIGPYIIGAYGIKLYGVGDGGRNIGRDRGSANGPAPDEIDTDDDLLTDGQEINGYWDGQATDWSSADPDLDGLSDYVEVRQGTDPWSADTDDDDLLDGDEARLVRKGSSQRTVWSPPNLPIPIDGDTDDDGLADSSERGRQHQSTDPNDPDSDHDGLPDGLESGLQAPELGGIWTDRTRLIKCGDHPIGRPTWMPSPGGLFGFPLDEDRDNDMLLDGLEDTNGDSILDPGELDPTNADTDGDSLGDSLELRIWGISKICDLSERFNHDFSTASRFRSENPWATDPHSPDTDGDGVPDGVDLDPRGLPTIEIDLSAYWQLRAIDIWTAGPCTKYSPELQIRITIETAVGSGVIETPVLDTLCIGKGEVGYLANVLSGKDASGVGGFLLGRVPKFIGSVVTLPLPNDFSNPITATTQGGQPLAADEVAITLHFLDHDWGEEGESDVIDLSADVGSTNTDHTQKFRLGSEGPAGATGVISADGGADGRWWAGDDDARLEGRFVTFILDEFLERVAGSTGAPPLLPKGGTNNGTR